MNNYWLLIIWIFAGGIVLGSVGKRYEFVNGEKQKRWQPWAALLLMFPYILWTGFRTNVYGDTPFYRQGYLSTPASWSQFGTYFSELTKDKGFSVLTFIIKQIFGNSDVVYFLIIAAIQLVIVTIVLRKYSSDYWLSLFVFIASTEYLSWCHNGIRQFLGLTLIFAGTKWLIEKKYIPLVILILVASTLHASLLLMIPVVFIVQGKAWNKKALLCIIITVIIVAYINQFTDILDNALSNTQYSNMVTDWTEWEDDGMNPIRAIVYSIPMILSLVGYKIIRQEDNPLINICVNMSILSSALSVIAVLTSGIFIGRLIIDTAIYSTFILLPWEIDNLFEVKSTRLMKILLVVGYLGFFYYQMHFSWELL